MKKKLLLYLSKLDYPANIPIASTLAWLCHNNSYIFDNYYDSYHLGVHFPGGDCRNLELGLQTGGTVCGDRHFDELYFLLLNFDVSVVSVGETIFSSTLKNLNVPILTLTDKISLFYREIFRFFDVGLPSSIVMLGSHFPHELAGLDAYFYPEVYHRQAIGVPEHTTEEELADLCTHDRKIYSLHVARDTVAHLRDRGYEVEIIDEIKPNDDYSEVTKRIALRWKEKAKGWIVGDPTLVSHWLPKACEEDLNALYSVPQEKIISEMGGLISSRGNVVYGRQYSDHDFFELSRSDQCLQVIDPCRPPFQSVKHLDHKWSASLSEQSFCEPEYSDEELTEFAREGKILISLMFWSGMIREVANFYNLMDLFAITKLRCGLVVTTATYEYMLHSPFELLTVPVEDGGVYPLVEPVLGSCGLGVGIESSMTRSKLEEDIKEGLNRILQKVQSKTYLPKGWWPTMDVDLEKHNLWTRPKPFRFLRYSPYFQIRFHADKWDHNSSPGKNRSSIRHNLVPSIKTVLLRLGLNRYFLPYRPYEFYKPGSLQKDIVEMAKSVGLEYMFTKSGFNSQPQVKYMDEDFIALNYTAGQWDGWTPFETVNDVADLKKSERIMLKRKRPGWIVSTIDSCLWTFTGEFWQRGTKLYEIAKFCADGGNSKKLINVKPTTIARYARIIAQQG